MKTSKKNSTKKISWVDRAVAVIGSRTFFIGIVVLFALQMIWIALSAIYPMLFDEEYHLGIIDIYSRQLSPFIFSQPPEAAFHGDITRYGSYLFHYLMSFPYRIVSFFTDDFMTKVIAMRLVCIGFVLVGFWLFRKVLLGFGLSRALSHSVLLVFTLIPLVPFALSQINYDSLQFVWVPLLILLTQATIKRSSRQAGAMALLLGVAGLATVTKFTALPIALGCVLFAGFFVWRQYRKKTIGVMTRQYRAMPRLKLILISCVLIAGVGLFIERYGVNVVAYRSYEPRCNVLHSVSSCREYTVFKRDDNRRELYLANPSTLMNPIEYSTNYWIPRVFGDFFVVGAFVYDNKDDVALRYLPPDLRASGGNTVLRYSGWAVLLVSIFLITIAAIRRRLTPSKLFNLSLLILGLYAAGHWIKNYTDYLHIGSAVAAQGRYYIPLLILVLAMVALLVKQYAPTARLRFTILLICLIPLTQGGGVMNYMLYSNKAWYWPRHERTIEASNRAAQRTIRLFTPL